MIAQLVIEHTARFGKYLYRILILISKNLLFFVFR